jgi:WD repeat-containing protein mio
MSFEPSQASEILAPLLVEDKLSEVPIFGPDRVDLETIINEATQTPVPASSLVEDKNASNVPLPESFTTATTIAEKMRALRAYAKEIAKSKSSSNGTNGAEDLEKAAGGLSITSEGPPSCRELHEDLLESLMEAQGLPRDAQVVFDHVMLLRAKEKYLFDAVVNHSVVQDDAWLRYTWDWIAGWSRFGPYMRYLH